MPARWSRSSRPTRCSPAPRHPYTAALLDALPERAIGAPAADHSRRRCPGIDDRPAGCLFTPRCRFAFERCTARSARRWPALAAPVRAACTPLRRRRPRRCERRLRHDASLMEARDVRRHYRDRRRPVRKPGAGQGGGRRVASRCAPGETLAVVGESGCGKSTLARVATLLEPPTAGELRIDGSATMADRRPRAPAAPVGPDGVPEPLWLAQPAQDGRRDPGGAAGDQHGAAMRPSARGGGARDDGEGRAAAGSLRPLSAHVLRRPAPAHRHRPRPDAAIRAWWWPTSRSRRSTSRSRPRC